MPNNGMFTAEQFIRKFICSRWCDGISPQDWAVIRGMLHGACLMSKEQEEADDLAFIRKIAALRQLDAEENHVDVVEVVLVHTSN